MDNDNHDLAAELAAKRIEAEIAALQSRWDVALGKIRRAGIKRARLVAMLESAQRDGGMLRANARGLSDSQALRATVASLLETATAQRAHLDELAKVAPRMYWFDEGVRDAARTIDDFCRKLGLLAHSADAMHDWHERRSEYLTHKGVFVEGGNECVEWEEGEHEAGGVAAILKSMAGVSVRDTAMLVAVYGDVRQWPVSVKSLRESLMRLNHVVRTDSNRGTKLAREAERIEKALVRFRKRRSSGEKVIRFVKVNRLR